MAADPKINYFVEFKPNAELHEIASSVQKGIWEVITHLETYKPVSRELVTVRPVNRLNRHGLFITVYEERMAK